MHDVASVVGEHALNRECDGIHHVVTEVLLRVGFVEPIVSDKSALTIGHADAGEAIGLGAGQFLDVFFVVVADVFAKSGLLVELGLLPVGAARVACVVWTLVPRLKNLHSLGVVLHDHKAGVGVGAVEAVGVVVGLVDRPGVQGHCDAVRRLDLPVVQHPLHGQVHEAEGGVCVEEDDELVVADVLGQGRGLDPGRVAILELVGADKLVGVAVHLGVCVVAEDTARDVVNLGPVILAVLVLLGRLERARLEIEDQHFFG